GPRQSLETSNGSPETRESVCVPGPSVLRLDLLAASFIGGPHHGQARLLRAAAHTPLPRRLPDVLVGNPRPARPTACRSAPNPAVCAAAHNRTSHPERSP